MRRGLFIQIFADCGDAVRLMVCGSEFGYRFSSRVHEM